MCVKLIPGDLNLDPYPPHPTSTYICKVTIAPRVCNGLENFKMFYTRLNFSKMLRGSFILK